MMVKFSVEPQDNNEANEKKDMVVDEEDDIDNEQEFQAISTQLDQLQSALDSLEKKTDDIHDKCVELLQVNRETRKEFQNAVQQ